jgi:hypothetical protein
MFILSALVPSSHMKLREASCPLIASHLQFWINMIVYRCSRCQLLGCVLGSSESKSRNRIKYRFQLLPHGTFELRWRTLSKPGGRWAPPFGLVPLFSQPTFFSSCPSATTLHTAQLSKTQKSFKMTTEQTYVPPQICIWCWWWIDYSFIAYVYLS